MNMNSVSVQKTELESDHQVTLQTQSFAKMLHVIKNLTENEEYTFQVMAVNSAGRSAPRESRPVIIKEQTMLPEFDLRAIYQKTVIAKAGDNIKIEIPVLGRPRPTVTWKKEDQILKQTQRVNYENTATATILTINECIRSDSGQYPLSAKNIVGEVSEVITVQVHDIPGPPTGPIKFEEISCDFLTFSWEPPLNDGGVPISNYVVEMRQTDSTTWTELATTVIRTTFKAIRLTTGVEYQFRVKAQNRYGVGPAITSESVVANYPFKVPGPPGTPQVIAVTKETMTISWNEPVSDGGSPILGYHIERKERNSIVWQTVSKMLVSGNIFKSSGLTDGIAYEFRVIAENLAGKSKPSKPSEPVFALDPIDPPGKPIPLNITRHAVTLKWTKPEYNGGFKITGYTVEKRDLPNGRWLKANFMLTIKEACRENVGSYLVKLTNSAGEATETLNIVVLDKPGPPTGPVKVDEVTADSITISWEPPKYDGGSSINNYIVERRDTSTTTWHIVSATVARTTIKACRLKTGCEYQFRIAAENRYGKSPYLTSESIVAQYPFKVPGPPGTPFDSMIVVWERPASDGGSEILGYVLEKRDKEGIRWTRCNKRLISELRYRVTGLIENHDYEYRVSAENAAGLSEPSPPSAYYKACDPIYKPGPPNNPKVTDVTRSSVFLSWGKPIYDGGSEIQGYIVEKCDVSDGEWSICTPPTGIKNTHLEVEKLVEKHEYKFRICAVNKAGVGEHADVPGSVIVEEKMEAPDLDLDMELRKIVNVRAGGSLRLFVPIRGRPTPEVKWGKVEGDIREAAIIDTTSSFTSLVLDNVNRFDSGKYTLTLENSSGTKSAFVSVRVLDTPSAPVNLKIREITKDSVSLSWEPPLLDGGAKIKNFIIEKREATRKAYAAVVTNCHKTSWKVDQLQEGCYYFFRISAENEYGIGLPAETSDPIKVAEVPQPPGKITVDDVTRNSVSLSWAKPEHDGGSKIIQYIVEMQAKGSEKWSECARVKTLEAVVTNLTQGEEYLFRVMAVNEKGKSDPRALAVPIVAKDLVIEPDVRPAFHSYSVQVGQDLKVEIPIAGRPKPTVTWVKDGQPLKQTTRVNVSDSTDLTVLNLKETSKEDSGTYEITVANVVGQKSASVEIITLDKPDPPVGPVKFDEISAETGSNLKVEIPVSGKPVPKVTLSRDGVALKPTMRFHTETTAESLIINLKESVAADAGRYDITAANSSGTTKSFVNIVVLDRPGPPVGPVVLSDVTEESVTLRWQPPAYDGGSQVTNYIVLKRETSTAAWSEVSATVARTVIKVMRLTTGEEYQFRIKAENRFGISDHIDSQCVVVKLPYSE
uniref:Uncharacterized protein n=1 Tax=Geospiza parvula TaxID=87175 RepID=A0A8U8C290_GEOPR